MTTEQRIIELEIRVAHQDKVIAALDDVLRAFTARVERLEQQLDAMRKSAGDLGAVGPADEPPPHY
jgi:SlyX protein